MLLGNIIVGIGAAAAFTTMALIEGLYFKERRSARKMMGYLCVIILALLAGFGFSLLFYYFGYGNMRCA